MIGLRVARHRRAHPDRPFLFSRRIIHSTLLNTQRRTILLPVAMIFLSLVVRLARFAMLIHASTTRSNAFAKEHQSSAALLHLQTKSCSSILEYISPDVSAYKLPDFALRRPSCF
jgi:hypothetical protein